MSRKNSGTRHIVDQKEEVRTPTDEAGGVATLEPGQANQGSPLAVAVDPQFLVVHEAERQHLSENLMEYYKLTEQRLEEAAQRMKEAAIALEKMGMRIPGSPKPTNGHSEASSTGKRRYGPIPGYKLSKARIAAMIAGRRKAKAAREAVAGEGSGEESEARPGSNTELVLRLVKQYAPNKKHAKTKAELRDLMAGDKAFKSLTEMKLNTGLQSNRPPKLDSPRIMVIPNPETGKTRGGRYYAL